MTANKMPEMPEADYKVTFHHVDIGGEPCSEERTFYTEAKVLADRRACYLAGIAAARECVPDKAPRFAIRDTDACNADFWDRCRETTLANLSALEQGVGK